MISFRQSDLLDKVKESTRTYYRGIFSHSPNRHERWITDEDSQYLYLDGIGGELQLRKRDYKLLRRPGWILGMNIMTAGLVTSKDMHLMVGHEKHYMGRIKDISPEGYVTFTSSATVVDPTWVRDINNDPRFVILQNIEE